MKKAKIDSNKCDKSPFCGAKLSCPVKAIEFKKKGLFSGEIVIDENKCVGCGKCINSCPHNAIYLV